MKKVLVCILVLSLMSGIFTGCVVEKKVDDDATVSDTAQVDESADARNPKFTITMENGDVMEGVLYPDKAPNTVNNFIALANSGFYDGLTFHRASQDFVIQGGDPDGNGTGGPGYSIKGEFSSNGFAQNDILHKKGVLSMARTANDPDSAGSQFFIVVGGADFLDGDYSAFGEITSGQSIADDISMMDADAMESIINPPVIKEIRVDTFGVEYPEPEKVH